jgi:uncharacterized membrane protein YhhN
MKKSIVFLVLFLIACAGDITTILLDSSTRYIFKPFILLALLGYYVIQATETNKTFIAALFFCWIGDVMLMFSGELYFMLGLVAFLIGHVFYIFSFRQLVWSTGVPLLPTQKVRYTFPIILAGTGLLVVLFPKLGALQIPVTVYAIVLMVMAINALFRLGHTNQASFGWVFIGALFFMISDSALAFIKFHTPFVGASVTIMLTYITAQFMIVNGILIHSATPH